ncbi:hypothetical protein ABWK22_02690 [Gottfriedia acidiceleris]|uniref:hypothetical protein n=1 Tax=Gottfriedia acidiceleris TaxID=371036 RepID=UPI0033975480
MKTSIDLAQEFKNILEEYGYDVLVLRQDKKLFCTCYNEVTQEVSRDCPLCLGMGYTFTAERHTTRSEGAVGATQLINALKTEDIGAVLTSDRKYYFLPNMIANEKDLIVEVDWDQFGNPSYSEKGIWKITNVDRTQKLGVNEVYKIYYSSLTPVRSKIRGIRISEINGVVQYSIIMEE